LEHFQIYKVEVNSTVINKQWLNVTTHNSANTSTSHKTTPKEKHSDSADEVRATPTYTKDQKTTASANIDEGNAVQGSDAALAPALSPPEFQNKQQIGQSMPCIGIDVKQPKWTINNLHHVRC